MNEALESQLSAMFDDELPEAECELLARRLSRDPALQARWDRYAAIGAVVRGADVRLDSKVAHAVNLALTAESAWTATALPVPRPWEPALPRWWRPLAGAAVAAGVATLSILWLQQNPSPRAAPLLAKSAAPAALIADTPASYVVPRALEARTVSMPATELANYVVAHSQFSTPVSRGNLLSGLMANESSPTGAPEKSSSAAGDPEHHADQSP